MWIEPLRFHTPTDLKSALLTGAECLDRGLDGIEPHNSGEIRMGSNHELTGADLWSRMWCGSMWMRWSEIRADPVTTTTDRNPAKSRMDFEKISNRDLAVELGFQLTGGGLRF